MKQTKLALFGRVSGSWKNAETVAQPDADFSYIPFDIQRHRRNFRPEPTWDIRPADPAGVAYYVSTTGDDTNDGLSAAAPLRKIGTAYAKADAAVIYVASGVYGNTNGLANYTLDKDISIIATGGAVITGGFAEPGALTFALDGTLTHTYKVTRSEVGAVWDVTNLDTNGDYTALTLQASAAAVEANPGSWYMDGTDVLWIRRSDDTSVTDTNCRIVYSSVGRTVTISGAITAYCEGIQFQGGNGNGCVQVDKTLAGSPTFYADRCSFTYSMGANGLSVTGADAILKNCVAAKNYDDGFNYHIDTGTICHAIEIGCTGRNNGLVGNIDNGSTIHDGCIIVRLMGNYSHCVGRNIHDITAGTKSWNLGCYSHDSASTSSSSKSNWAVGTGAGDTAIMWLDCCQSSGSVTDIEISAASTCYVRNFIGGGVYVGTPTAY
ncbi:MAG: hypothetical protein WC710_14245 [Gallionella sp.]|jgi:hypothetical protein